MEEPIELRSPIQKGDTQSALFPKRSRT